MKLAEAYVQITGNMTHLAMSLSKAKTMTIATMQSMGRSVSAFGAKLQTMGMMGAKAFVVVGAAMGALSYKFGSFQESMQFVSTMLDEQTMKLMPRFRKGVLAMSSEFGEATKTMSMGLYSILSASIAPDKAMSVLRKSMTAARAGMTDTGTAARALVNVLKAYGWQASQVGKVSDILFATVKRGQTTFGELASNIATVAPTAAAVGLSLEEVGMGLATITRAGLNTSRAATAMNTALMTFLKPTDEARKVAAKYGLELNSTTLRTKGLLGVLKQLRTASQEDLALIFNRQRALRGVVILMKQLEGATKDLNLMYNSAGRTQEAFEKTAKGLAFQFNRARQSLSAFAVVLGEVIFGSGESAGLLERLADTVADLSKKVDVLTDRQKEVVVQFAKVVLLATGLTASLLVVGLTVSAVGATIGSLAGVVGFILSPMGALVVAALAVGAAMNSLGATVGQLKEYLATLWESVAPAWKTFADWVRGPFADGLFRVWTDLKIGTAVLVDGVAEVFDALASFIGSKSDDIGSSLSNLSKVSSFSWDAIVFSMLNAKPAMEKLGVYVKRFGSDLDTTFTWLSRTIGDSVVNMAQNIYMVFKNALKLTVDAFKNTGAYLSDWFTAIWEKIKDPTKKMKMPSLKAYRDSFEAQWVKAPERAKLVYKDFSEDIKELDNEMVENWLVHSEKRAEAERKRDAARAASQKKRKSSWERMAGVVADSSKRSSASVEAMTMVSKKGAEEMAKAPIDAAKRAKEAAKAASSGDFLTSWAERAYALSSKISRKAQKASESAISVAGVPSPVGAGADAGASAPGAGGGDTAVGRMRKARSAAWAASNLAGASERQKAGQSRFQTSLDTVLSKRRDAQLEWGISAGVPMGGISDALSGASGGGGAKGDGSGARILSVNETQLEVLKEIRDKDNIGRFG